MSCHCKGQTIIIFNNVLYVKTPKRVILVQKYNVATEARLSWYLTMYEASATITIIVFIVSHDHNT